jgi:hypothetical protein
MDYVRDTSRHARAVTVACRACGLTLWLSEALIDLAGPAYQAYYHEQCAPRKETT